MLVNTAGISGPTAAADELSPDDWEKVVQVEALATQSLKHLVDPRHIADLAVFLASDTGRAISGQMLPIDCDMQRT